MRIVHKGKVISPDQMTQINPLMLLRFSGEISKAEFYREVDKIVLGSEPHRTQIVVASA